MINFKTAHKKNPDTLMSVSGFFYHISIACLSNVPKNPVLQGGDVRHTAVRLVFAGLQYTV